MAKKQFKDPFANIRATQEKDLKRLQDQASKPMAAPPAPTMAGFRQLEAESMKMPIPEYKPPSQAGAIKRSLGALGLGLLEGTEKLREKYSADKLLAERISPELDMIRPKYTPLITPEQSKQYEENIGLQGTLGEGIWRGIGAETPAIALSYGAIGAATKVPKIAKALTGTGKWTETGRRGVAAGALYTPIAEEKPELKDYLENMALFGAGDVAFMGAIHGIGKGIGKGIEALKGFKRPKDIPESEATLDYLMGESPAPVKQQPDYVPPPRVAPDFTGTPYGGVYRGEPRAELPGVPERLALPAGKDYLALTPGEQPPMLPEGYYPNWEFGNRPEADFAVDYGGGTMAKGVDYPPARIPGVDYGGDISLRNKQRALVDIDQPIPRSDIGDPAYLAGLEKQYGDFVAEEVARMKSELGGVVNVPERDMRVSQNPFWYREFWQKHMRVPHEGEYRDLAIKNLMEGNPETGEPANDEFLAILSELSRGQKLPEEWHGLQQGVRDMEALQEPELQPLIGDMQAEQAKVEPYGLNRDMDRLNEVENGIRGKTRMVDKADFGQHKDVKFKNAPGAAGNRKTSSNYTKAARKFGTTNDFREAGYLTSNGKLLDFSGKREGGPSGVRYMDHREIEQIYGLDSSTDAMIEFMNEGNIRMQNYGFEISKQPTKEQERVLVKFINENNGEVVADLNKTGGAAGIPASIEYPAGTKATKIISDIRRFYEVGEKPHVSEMSKFRFKRGQEFAPTFYSQLQRTIEQKMPNRATTDQIRGIIGKGAVKEEEIRWSGLDDFLAERQGQKVSKQEVLDYLKENDVQVQEVKPSSTKYDQYQLPGGDNYRELLFTMPEKPGLTDAEFAEFNKLLDEGRNGNGFSARYYELAEKATAKNKENIYRSGHWSEPNVLAHVRFNDRTGANGEKILHVEEVQSDWHQEGRKKGYQKPLRDADYERIRDAAHKVVDDNNYLGYSNRVEALAFVRRNPVDFIDLAKQEGVNETGINALREYAQSIDTGTVPDAPFKTTWHELTMKRIIRYAAENGYDRISWTTGEQQAARYSLAEKLDTLYLEKTESGYFLSGDKGHSMVVDDMPVKDESHLSELIGKDLARKLINSDEMAYKGGDERHPIRVLSDIDTQIGGEGMKGFYDKMIPTWLNKYAKKWGARVEETNVTGEDVPAKIKKWEDYIEDDSLLDKDSYDYKNLKDNWIDDSDELVLVTPEDDWRGMFWDDWGWAFKDDLYDVIFPDESAGINVHSLPITQKMKDSVLYEGQPKFKRNLTPEQQQDLEVLKVVAEQRKIGPFTINKVELAPEAMERPDFQAAGEIAEKLGLRMVTFKGKGARGAQHSRTLYINEGIKDPVDYVFLHEVTHSMQDFHPQHYGRLFDLSLEHLADVEGIDKHYIEQGYARADRPHEFAADVFAEAMSTPGFFARIAERAPELVKPLLEAIDRLIANVKSMVSKDDTIIPYMRDWEVLRQRIRDEVAMPYFKDAMGEKQFVDTFGHKWQDPAAKAKAETAPEVADNINTPEFRKWFGDSKVVDEQGNPLVVYHGTNKDFSVFSGESAGDKTGNPTAGWGFFFTHRPAEASSYATDWTKEGGNVMPVYVSVKNPYIMPYSEYGQFTHLDNLSEGQAGLNRLADLAQQRKKELIEQGYDGIYVMQGDYNGKHITDSVGEIVAFDSTQMKSVYNRGTWDPTNPDIRFKLGEGGKSPVDDFTAMVQYGVKQIPKGNFDHFSKLIQKQFPDELAGYSPEITERLMKDIWAHSRKLRDAGETVVTLQGKQYPIKRGEVGNEARARDSEQVPGDIGEIDTRSHIVSKTQRDPIIAKETAKMVYTKAVDDLYRIDEMDKFVAKTTGKHLPAEDKAYLLAINSREATGAARAILEENLVDAQGNIIGPAFKEVLNNIPKGKEPEFRDYLVLKNSISWMEQGKKVYPEKWGMTPEKAMQRLAAYDQQMPELKQAADDYVNWHRQMTKAWLVDTGILTPEMWEAFLQTHPHYVSFQRQMKPIETTPGQGKARRGFANQTNPTKKAEGSERPIIDPIESTIEQVDRYIKTAKRNEVMQAVIRNLEKAPEELEGFAEVMPDKNMDVLDNINAILERDGIDGVINYLEEPFEQMAARMAKSEQPLNKPNIVRAFVNGERVHVKVNDPVLLDSLTALSDTGRNAIVETFRTATRLMKILTTGGNPIFAARNIARDVPMAYVASDTLSKTPVVREAQFAWGMVDALARIITNERWHPDKFYREYKAMGGGSHTASVAADRNILAESKSKVMPGYWSPKNNNPLTYIGKGAKAGFQGIERFTSTVEALPRLPEYIRTVKKGGNDYASRLEGLHASQDVTVNFSRHGDISKDADAFIPYFNAAVQGIEKIARMWGSDPLGATYRSIVAVTIPTVGLYLLNKDNPKYHKLSSIIRDNYYCIPIQGGEKFIKVAKPREIGVVFSDLPERALRQWEADDPEGFYQFSEAWINNFVPPIRPIVMPAADILANKDFAGRPIVPGYMEGLSPELQYDEKTSAAAKAIGDALKLSPKQIDYLFRSYAGVVGELGIPAMAEGRGQNAGQRVGEVLKRTFTADPLYSNDITNKFYEQKERYDTAAKDFKNTGNRGEYFDPVRQRYFSRQANRISNIRKEIRKVNADPNLSYEEKEERTRRMQANMLEIAQRAAGDRFSPRIAR